MSFETDLTLGEVLDSGNVTCGHDIIFCPGDGIKATQLNLTATENFTIVGDTIIDGNVTIGLPVPSSSSSIQDIKVINLNGNINFNGNVKMTDDVFQKGNYVLDGTWSVSSPDNIIPALNVIGTTTITKGSLLIDPVGSGSNIALGIQGDVEINNNLSVGTFDSIGPVSKISQFYYSTPPGVNSASIDTINNWTTFNLWNASTPYNNGMVMGSDGTFLPDYRDLFLVECYVNFWNSTTAQSSIRLMSNINGEILTGTVAFGQEKAILTGIITITNLDEEILTLEYITNVSREMAFGPTTSLPTSANYFASIRFDRY